MTALASTPYTLAGTIVGYTLALLGVVLLVRVATGRPVGWRRVCAAAAALRRGVAHPSTDSALRTAGWVLPGAGLALAAVASGATGSLGVTGVLGFGVAITVVLAVVACAPVLLPRRLPARRSPMEQPAVGTVVQAGRDQTPRGQRVARSARGRVVSPAGGSDGDATLIFLRPAASPLSAAGVARLDGAAGSHAHRRAWTAAVTDPVAVRVPAPCCGSGAGTPPDQTVVLHRVQDQATETWQRIGATTPTR